MPRRHHELLEKIREQSESSPWEEDDWHQYCRDSFPTTAYVLFVLAKEDIWPVDRWRENIPFRTRVAFICCAVPDIISRLNRMPMGAIKY